MLKLFFKIKRWFFKMWTKQYQVSEVSHFHTPHWHSLSPLAASIVMSKIKWTKDGYKELWDASHHPYYSDYIINSILSYQNVDVPYAIEVAKRNSVEFQSLMSTVKTGDGQPVGSFDCDDFALWGAKAILSKYKPVVLSVFFKTGFWPWQVGGHAVCMYLYNKRYYHIGNWGKSKGYVTVQELVNDIVSQVGGKKLVDFYTYTVSEITND